MSSIEHASSRPRPSSKRPKSAAQNFLTQISKVVSSRIPRSPRHQVPLPKSQRIDKLIARSPFQPLKSEGRNSGRKSARKLMTDRAGSQSEDRMSRVLIRKCVAELALRKVAEIVGKRLRDGLTNLRRNHLLKERQNPQFPEGQSTRYESQVSNNTKSDPLAIPSYLALTECPKCRHIGLSLLTTSTREQFSPKFLQKIKGILPAAGEFGSGKSIPQSDSTGNRTETKVADAEKTDDLRENPKELIGETDGKDPGPDLSMDQYEELAGVQEDIPDISEIHRNPESLSIDSSSLDSEEPVPLIPVKSPGLEGRSQTVKYESSFDFLQEIKRGRANTTDIMASDISRMGLKVPRLNFTYLHSPVKLLRKQPVKNCDSRKSQKTKLKDDSDILTGFQMLRSLFFTRMQRAFDMTLLSRTRWNSVDTQNRSLKLTKKDLEMRSYTDGSRTVRSPRGVLKIHFKGYQFKSKSAGKGLCEMIGKVKKRRLEHAWKKLSEAPIVSL